MLDWREIRDEKDKYQAYLCSREWSVVKQKVLERSGGRCERCKVNPHESTHHLTYARKYNERPEDLQGICNKCHKFIHGKSDFDPAIRPPVVNGKVVETFYLAGKITGTTWRDQIVPGWSFENDFSATYARGVDITGEFCEWHPVKIAVPGRFSGILYLGPWWCDTLSYYGGHGRAQSMNGPHACVDDGFYFHGCLDKENAEKFFAGTMRLVFEAISKSDLVFAWIDSTDCYGTLFEIGLAFGLGKTVVFASPPCFDSDELWLSRFFSRHRVVAETPRLAWESLWATCEEQAYGYSCKNNSTEAHA